MKKIIAFTGSNNPNSINEKLVKSIIQDFPDVGIEFLDLKEYDVPIYSQTIENNGMPERIKKLFQKFVKADGFILASPEHNGLPSAFLKNIIDWLSRIDQKFLGNKPIVLLSASPGITGGRTHLQLMKGLVGRWGGKLVGYYSLGSFQENFDYRTGRIADDSIRKKVNKEVRALIAKNPTAKKTNVEVVEEYFRAFATGDLASIRKIFHPDCYIVSVKEQERSNGELHGIYRGRGEVDQLLGNIAALFETKNFSTQEINSTGGDLVVARGKFSHRVKSTGKLFNSDWVQLCWIADEMIKEYRFYEDSAALTFALVTNASHLEL